MNILNCLTLELWILISPTTWVLANAATSSFQDPYILQIKYSQFHTTVCIALLQFIVLFLKCGEVM